MTSTFSLLVAQVLLLLGDWTSAFQMGVGFQSSSRELSSSSSSSSLHATGTAIVSPEKFQALQKAFPKDYNVVKAGGWYKLQTLASLDPKKELVNMIVNGLQTEGNKVEFQSDEETLEALLILLYGKGKGFEADAVDGDWALVFSRQGTKSPRFQKLVGRKEKAGFTLNTFDIQSMTFAGDVKFFKNKALVHSTVKYDPLSTNYSKTVDGKIVLRRIGCDIIDAYFKFWKLPGLSLPLKRKGGYLDFIYMDKDIRITRGNRGGLFIHFRPEFLESHLA